MGRDGRVGSEASWVTAFVPAIERSEAPREQCCMSAEADLNPARVSIALSLALLLGGLPGCGRARSPVAAPFQSAPSFSDSKTRNAAWTLPASFVAAPDAKVDPALGLPTRVQHLPSGVSLVLIREGEFWMGTAGETGHEARHRRRVARPFYLGESEVTVAQFRRFADATGHVTDAETGLAPEDDGKVRGAFATPDDRVHTREWDPRAHWRNPFPMVHGFVLLDDHPVSQVSWNDAVAFCRHFQLELPTEAQWEYAYRAGSPSTYPWGDDPSAGAAFMNGGDIAMARRFPKEAAGYPVDDGHPTHAPVRSFRPSPWGLFDMAGNVEEWTSHDFKVPLPRDGDDETAPPPSTDVRVLRGSTWFSSPEGSEPWRRYGMRPFSRRDFIGFRVALNLRESGHP